MMKQRILGALVLVCAGMLGSCSSEDLLTGTPNTKWHATGTATMDTESELTRALSVGGNSGKTLYFNWAGGETMLVRNASGGDAGTMTATVNPGNTAIATIAGDVTGTYSVGDKVTYYYPSVEMDLTGQKGTIADLSKNFHYMSAPVTVKAVDAEQKAITMGGATFTRRYAVLRLRLTDSDGNRLNVEELKISSTSGHLVKSVTADGTKTYYAANEELTITPDKEDGAYPNEFFIALLNDYDNKDTYSFTAKVGNSVYSSVTDAQKISAKLVENKFYTAVRKLTKTVDGDVETTGDFTFSTISPQTYTGSQITPAVTVYYQGSAVSSSDYELHYFSNTDVGKAFVVAVGKAGTSVADKTGITTFTINSETISESMLTPIGTQTYTGSPIEPAVTMSGLTQGTDYTVSYANNTNVGTATATITAIGNYTGELEATFTIQKATPTITLTTTEMKLKPEDTETRTATTTFGTVTYKSSDESVATVDATGKVTAVADGTAIITASVAADDNWNAASKQYTVTVGTVTTPEGAISGQFTVGMDGSTPRKVFFSKGNLQYIGSATTPYWQFAEHQYDYLGTTTGQNSDATNVDRDLFGWGTSGKTISNYGSAYQPYATNTTNTNYGPKGSNYNLTGDYANGDWGVNAISNGGNTANSGWRTLSMDEWKYVFGTNDGDRRSGATVGGTSNARYTEATINTDGTGVNGVILFPDGATFAASEASWGTINSGSDWGTRCTTAQWTALEAKGCVFLPAAGDRKDGTVVHNFGSFAYYWSSTAQDTGHAFYVFFCSGYVFPADYQTRIYGFSVRLVRDAN